MDKTGRSKNPESFYIYTLGCKTNQSESDTIARGLATRGLKPSTPGSTPDLIIINTCTVTSSADKKTRQAIRRLKRKFPSSTIVVTGCFTVFNEPYLKKSGIDCIILNNKKPDMMGLMGVQDGPSVEHPSAGHSRALIKIQDGCEQKCSYCIVPFVRGDYWSRPYQEVIDEAARLVEEKHDEIVLTGIHIGKYGIDIPKKGGKINNLAGLIYRILEKTDIKRIRLSSLEINELTVDIIELISSSDGRIARHLHIPLQSGSDDILKRMNRPYSSKYFLNKIKRLKETIPGIALTTDVITGFPGETRKDFLQTIRVLKDTSFSKIHVFKYSSKENTDSFLMDGRVDEKEISSRSKKIREIGDELRKEFIETLTGSLMYPVCEEYDRRNNMFHGISEQYIRVYADIEYDSFVKKKGRIIRVQSKAPYLDGLLGTVL